MFGLGPEKKFTFVNWGGSYQLRIEKAEDLTHLDELDEPFWLATSAPIYQLRGDPVALDHLDANGNKRIISNEIRRTRRWLFRVFRNLEGVSERRDALTLADVNSDDPDGSRILVTARRVLTNLDRTDSPTISLADIRNTAAILSKDALNGDGVIPPGSMEDEDLRAFLVDIIATCGGAKGIGDREGVDRKQLNLFHQNATDFLAWQETVAEASGSDRDRLLPLGEDTAAAFAVFDKVRAKMDEFFALCEVMQINESLGRKTLQPEPAATLFESDDERRAYLEAAPVAPPSPSCELRFDAVLNPRFRAALFALRDKVVQPVLFDDWAPDMLRHDQWAQVCDAFKAYEEWLGQKSGAQVEALGTDTLRRYVADGLRERAITIIDHDLSVGKELAALKELEKLVLMQRWFLDVCNNFISFRDMYDLRRQAMFEIGRLVIDGRIFNFNVRVEDPKAHARAAERSGMFLLYSEVTSGPDDQSFYIVTPITARHRGNLGLNKRGVLFDYRGKQWDTRVVEVVENPISLPEAILAPFKKISDMIGAAVEKITSSTEKQLESSLKETTATVEQGVVTGIKDAPSAATQAVPAPAPAAAPDAPPAGRARDMVMTGGVAVAALGSSFAFIAKTFADLKVKQALAAVGIGLAVIMIPVILVAIFKLYNRNLSSILEASGWAVNARMRLTRSLAHMLAPDPVRPDSFAKVSEDLVRTALRENPLAAALRGRERNATDEAETGS